MPYSVDIIEELQILTLYNLANAQEGLKIQLCRTNRDCCRITFTQ